MISRSQASPRLDRPVLTFRLRDILRTRPLVVLRTQTHLPVTSRRTTPRQVVLRWRSHDTLPGGRLRRECRERGDTSYIVRARCSREVRQRCASRRGGAAARTRSRAGAFEGKVVNEVTRRTSCAPDAAVKFDTVARAGALMQSI